MESWWEPWDGKQLYQGALLPECLVPDWPAALDSLDVSYQVKLHPTDLIVMTQSCDLLHKPPRFVALCRYFRLPEYEDANASFKKKGAWEQVRKGYVAGLHLLASPEAPEDNRQALVVDFREIYSLPHAYLCRHAEQLPAPRWRLRSPYLEHFSQAFARFFMRVGLPTAIPPYK